MVDSFAGTLAFIVATLMLAYALGYGVVTFLLPPEYREYRLVVMPVTGYLTYSLLVMMISGNFRASVTVSVWIAFALLAALGVAAFVRGRRKRDENRNDPNPDDPKPNVLKRTALLSEWRLVGLLMLPTAIFVLWPTLIQGAEMYLGSVNLDFFQSMMFQEILRTHHLSVFAEFEVPRVGPADELAGRVWPAPFQARFGGVMFSYLLQSLTGISTKSAVSIAMCVFVLCLPLTVYFFSRVVLGLTRNAAILGSLVIGICAPITLGYVYVLVGQSSGMPILPLLITVLFITLTRPSPRMVAYAALVTWGLFWLYASMLMFAVAPMGLFALYLLVQRKLSIRWALAIVLGGVVAGIVIWAAMPGDLIKFVMGLVEISGRLVGTVFFLDYLTELFFVHNFGITSYPSTDSAFYMLVNRFAPNSFAWALAVSLAAIVTAFVVASYIAWRKSGADDDRRKAVASMLFVYFAVWVVFTFASPYGYSVFKMTMWLQFLGVPLLAFGLVHFWRGDSSVRSRRLARFAAGFVGLTFVSTNLLATIDHGDMSFGKNRKRGYVVIAFGMGANPDIATLGRDLAPKITPDQTIGLAFTDPLQSFWSAYRLMGKAKQVVLSHEMLDADDSYLPDPESGMMKDSAGAVKWSPQLRLADIASDFYLLPGKGNMNPEIIEQSLPKPLWENSTYQLHSADTLTDFLFLGHGFYRASWAAGDKPWWEPPGPARWSPEGAEFYILQPAQPGKPYRLSFTGMAGFGYPAASRTLEFWHDGKKFDEFKLSEVGRVITAPFYPTEGLDRVLMVIRERMLPYGRTVGLWHRDLPNPRNLNVLMSNVRLLRPGETPVSPIGTGPITGDDILNKAHLFNGLSNQRWVPAAASLAYSVPVDRPRAELEFMIPGNLGFKFPYTVKIVADGVEHSHVAEGPGTTKAVIPLPDKKANDVASFEIRPQEGREIDDAFSKKNRPIVQSVRLESVQFTPMP